MPDDLTRLLAVLEGDGPSPDFVSALRAEIETALHEERLTAHSLDRNGELGPEEGDLIMVDIQTRGPDSQEPDAVTRRIPRRYVGLAAAAAIIAIVAIVSFDGSEDASVIVDEPIVDDLFAASDALTTVEAYYTAVEAGDADAIAALFVDPSGDVFDENLRLEIWNAGQGMIRVDRVCSAAGSTPEGFAQWACEFGDHQYLQRVAGVLATQIRQTFTVSANGIEELHDVYLNDGYDANDSFNSWMEANHPEDAAAADCCGGNTIEEARANGELRRQYADLWVAYLEDTVEAYYTAADAGDADGITALFVEPSGDVFDETLRLEIWNAGQEAIRVDRVCSAAGATSSADQFILWVCEYGDHQYLQRVAGAPATQISQTFTVSANGIEELHDVYLNDGYDANDSFNSWMEANHPEDAAAADCCGGNTIEEARANGELRRQYADLWVAYLEESGCTYQEVGC